MSRPRSPVADYLIYLAVRLFVCLIQALPLSAGYRLARLVAWLAYHFDRRHRLVALDNLRHAFPELPTEAEHDRLVRGVYRHFCTMIVEIAHLPRKLHTPNWRRYVDVPNARALVDCLTSGRPLLLVTGHFGNWELASFVLGLLGFASYAIARPLDNPHLERFLHRFREKTGQTILAKKGDFDDMQAVLAGGGVLAMLADQDAGSRGQFVEFFGRPASTHKAVALLALEYQVPVLVAGMARLGAPLRHRLLSGELILPEEFAGRPDAAKALTQRFSAALEQIVRTAPEQYLWLHRRWKHQPGKRKRKRAA
jgi:KDO2-lipid IV(A) lauroyltransferase